MTLYVDGSFYNVYNVAAWSVIDMDSNTKMSGRVPGAQTNNRAEMMAMVAALTLVVKRGIGAVKIMTDSQYTRRGTIGDDRRLTNFDLWPRIDEQMQQGRVQHEDIVHVDAHNNGIADIAAKNEAMAIANRPRQQRRVAYDPALDGWPSDDEDVQQPRRQQRQTETT